MVSSIEFNLYFSHQGQGLGGVQSSSREQPQTHFRCTPCYCTALFIMHLGHGTVNVVNDLSCNFNVTVTYKLLL